MRIAHVSDCYLPRLGGIELHVRDLAAHQRAAGHDVEVLTSTEASRRSAGSSGGSSGSSGGSSGRPSIGVTGGGRAERATRRLGALVGTVPSPSGLAELRATIARGGYDVVHAHTSTASPLAWAGVHAAVRAGVPTALTLHSMLSPQARLLSASATTVGWARWPVAWTAVSSAAAEPLRRALTPTLGSEPVTVLPNGIDDRFWRMGSPRTTSEVLTIASVMRLSRRKRPQALLRILATVRAAVAAEVPLRAVIVGDGPLRGALERELRATGLGDWVTLTGALDRTQVREVLAHSDVYLSPAHLESFGIAALEARCAGLPVIAMAAGGVQDFVGDGAEGFLVDSDDEMARMTAHLLESPRLREMQEHNRLTAASSAWPVTVDRSLAVYDRAIGAVQRVRGVRLGQPVAG